METVLAFLHGALPWLSIGLMVAVVLAKNAKKEEGGSEDCGTQGMCIGMCFGSAIGAAGVVSIGISLPLGMLVGMLIGSAIPKKEDTK